MNSPLPDPQKGQNRMLIVVIISTLPGMLSCLLTWIIWLDFDGSREFLLILGLIQLFILGIAVWLFFTMLQKKQWARIGWIVLCGVWLLGLLLMGYITLVIGVNAAIPILVTLGLLYVGAGLYLYWNSHIGAFFKSKDAGLEKKIEELGKTSER